MTQTKKAVIFGTAYFAQVVRFYLDHDSPYEVVAFTASEEAIDQDTFDGLPLVPFERLEERFPPDEVDMYVAIGYRKMNRIRAQFVDQARAKGYRLLSYVCSKATTWPGLKLGENCFIFEDNTIQPFVEIGDDVVLWSGNHIGHHARIGDHCFISSHVVVSGAAEIGAYSFVGVNATFHDSVRIGEGCFVGAGSLIDKSYEDKQVFHESGSEPRKITSDKLRF